MLVIDMEGEVGAGPGDRDRLRLEVSMFYWNWLEIWREIRLRDEGEEGDGTGV